MILNYKQWLTFYNYNSIVNIIKFLLSLQICKGWKIMKWQLTYLTHFIFIVNYHKPLKKNDQRIFFILIKQRQTFCLFFQQGYITI